MTSFIIIARGKEKRVAYAQEYCRKLAIDTFDISLIEKEPEAKSIGIEGVKNMQKKIFLRPLKSPTKAILIEESHLLTTEAQNALLKVLEEPPDNTLILLLTESAENLLPTIISRCKVIKLEEQTMALSEEEREEYSTFLAYLSHMTVGERLKKAELLAKDKEKGVEWIGRLLLVMRESMLHNVILASDEGARLEDPPRRAESQTDSGVASLPRMTNHINAFQQLHKLLKSSNANPRMAIEDTLLADYTKDGLLSISSL